MDDLIILIIPIQGHDKFFFPFLVGLLQFLSLIFCNFYYTKFSNFLDKIIPKFKNFCGYCEWDCFKSAFSAMSLFIYTKTIHFYVDFVSYSSLTNVSSLLVESFGSPKCGNIFICKQRQFDFFLLNL